MHFKSFDKSTERMGFLPFINFIDYICPNEVLASFVSLQSGSFSRNKFPGKSTKRLFFAQFGDEYAIILAKLSQFFVLKKIKFYFLFKRQNTFFSVTCLSSIPHLYPSLKLHI